ncbi:hypothetical protein GR268_44775, partial [Rhizobium leguminosarum]|nr:hypothetical protein [Rhizobium leguminosarum]
PAMHHLEVVLGALFSFVNLLLRHLVEKDGKTYYIAEDFEVKGDQLIVYSGSDKPVQLEDKEIEDKESFIVQNTENWLRTVLRNPADTGNEEGTELQDYNKWCAKLVMLKYKLGREQKGEKKKTLEERIKALEQQIQDAPWKKREEVIDVPKHLREFTLKQIPHWTRSALLA